MPSLDAAEFWSEVRRRRNWFFLAGPSWLVLGPLLAYVYSVVLRTDSWRFDAALVSWMALMWWLQKRVTDLLCYRCGRRAFVHAFFFMRHAKCGNCGATYLETLSSQSAGK